MTNSEKLRRFGFDKVALFLLLLAGLVLAKLIVFWRAGFKPSKPIILPGRGLAVSVPMGGGFRQLSDSFKYNDNEFRLSVIMPISNDAAVRVNWRYFILPSKKTVPETFQSQASNVAGVIEKTGSQQFGQLTFDYATITSEKTAVLFFSGITQLPDGRTLTLEVIQKGWERDLAEKIFRSLAASATFTAASPLADGSKLLDNFRRKGFTDIVRGKTTQNYYYIKNYMNQNLGFVTDAIKLRSANSFTAANLYFLHSGKNSFAEQSLFHSDANLQSFKWMSQQSDLSINRDLITSIELDREGTVAIQRRNAVQNFDFAPTMLPEILLDILIQAFLQSDFNSVMVDTILSDGRIIPVLVSRERLAKTAEPNAVSAVETVFFGTDASQQTIYFDSNGKILLSETHGKLSYKLERTERDRIISDFPQWLEKIRQTEQYIFEKPKD